MKYVYILMYVRLLHYLLPERRHGFKRVSSHAFLAWCSSWWCIMYNVQYIIHSVIDQPYTGTNSVVCQAGGMDRPSRTISHPAGSFSSSLPSGPPCWASPLVFGLIRERKNIEENSWSILHTSTHNRSLDELFFRSDRSRHNNTNRNRTNY
jgi:hypothetical protein